MSGHFSRDSEQRYPLRNERGSTTRVLLLVLLLLVAVAGYLFYFTDIFKPRQEAVKPPAGQVSQIKQPIPPRPGPGGATANAPAKAGEAKPSPGAPAPPATSSAGAPAPPQPPPQAQAQPVQKPAPAKTAATTPPSQPAPQPAAAPRPAPPVTAPAAAPKPAPPVTKPAAAPKPAPPAKKEPAPAKPAQKAEIPVEIKTGGPYRLLIGDFVPDKSFGATLAKLKKSGIEPVRKSAVSVAEPMNRLFIAEFGDQDAAEAELQKLKKLTPDAFLIYENGKFILYGGSYLSPARADSELKKLGSKGVSPVIRKAQVTIKVTRVTAGSYANSEEARKDAVRLKKLGFHATVVKAAR